jgi:peptidoglycan-associated lipoprotein
MATGLLLLLCGSVGCKPKPPAPAADLDRSTTDVSSPREVTSAPNPTPKDDTPATPLSGDLREAQNYAVEKGLLGEVYFEFDSSNLDGKARERLAKNAEFLRSGDGGRFVLTIEGHCDERGTNEYNLALGERRSNAARDYLISLGIPAGRLRTISYGEERGVCSESDEGCWWRNRRAYFRITDRS